MVYKRFSDLNCHHLQYLIFSPCPKWDYVVIDKCDYVNKLSNLLSDQSKFVELTIIPLWTGKLQVHLYYLKCRGALDLPTYNKLRPSGSKPGRIYGLPKVHKTDIPMRLLFHQLGLTLMNFQNI